MVGMSLIFPTVTSDSNVLVIFHPGNSRLYFLKYIIKCEIQCIRRISCAKSVYRIIVSVPSVVLSKYVKECRQSYSTST